VEKRRGEKILRRGKKMRTRYFLISTLLIALLGGCGSKESVSLEKPSKSPDQISEERQVEAVEVVPKAMAYTLSAVGSLKTPELVTISPKKAGIISKILVKEGDPVKKGQILVQLDDVDARLQVERAEARVREAEASLETNRTTLTRYKKLLESKVVSQQLYDDLSLKVKLDEAKLDLARTELHLARQNLLDHQIFSPIEGMVNLKMASIGEHVNVAPKDEILKIVQMDPLELEFYIPENWVGRIRKGTRIQFTVKAFSDEKHSATLQMISPTADPATRNVKMKAMASNPHYRLKPGFFAEITIPVGENTKGMLVPESALLSQEGSHYVFIVLNGVAHRREVETGIRMGGQVEITKGLRNGEQVVTAGYEQLKEGIPVKVLKPIQKKGTPSS
jgi:membrane fusion protein (multidrug efflux system)